MSPSPQHSEEAYFPETAANKSLRLAQTEDFYAMCSVALWGNETEELSVEFGELLRGVIEQFLPRNRWELHLLTGVVTAYWKLRRLLRTQTNVFNSKVKEETLGRHGLPAAVYSAESFEDGIDRAQRSLKSAISLFQSSRVNANSNQKAKRKSDEEYIEWWTDEE
jgi:hypothetical protein